jgi:hypothetical protein
MIRTFADRTPGGAWTGPVVRGRHASSGSVSWARESMLVSALPEASALVYHETRSQAASIHTSSYQSQASNWYQPSGSTAAVW